MGALPVSKIIFATCRLNFIIACLQFLTIVIILISAPSLRSDRYGGGIPFLCLRIIFMLEQTINDHTLAVRELTAAVRELTAALQQSALPGAPAASATASAPSFSTVPPAAYGPAGASEAAAAVAAADALSGASASCVIMDALPSAASAPAEAPAPAPAPVTAGTVEAPAPAPVTQPAPAAAAEPAAPITPEALRALCIRAGQAGHTAYVVDFLRTRSVQMLADLPAKYHAELVQSLAAMGVN